MRFHFGVSLRPNISWLKWIGVAIVGLLAFFGIGNHVVLAATTGTYNWTPSYAGVVDADLNSALGLTLVSRTGGVLGDNYYINFSSGTCPGGVACSPVYNGYAYFGYPKHDFCPDSDTVVLTFKYFTRTTTPPTIFSSNYFATNVRGWYLLNQSFNTSDKYYTTTIKIQDNVATEFQLGFNSVNEYDNFYFVSAAISKAFTYSCDYSLEESTTDIINNNNNNTNNIINNQNQNTQDIIDNLTDDTISNDTIDTGNDFFDNFSTSSTTGFSGIINAPIRIFQSMVNNNACTPLVLPISLNDGNVSGSSNVSLPCGNILWDNAPNAVVLMWHTIIFGVLGYRLLLDLVKFVNRLLNPNSTSEYVMDL